MLLNRYHLKNLSFKNKAAKYVFENKIPLEICPTSNIQGGAFNSIPDHSFGKLYKLGFNVTINTDNRLMSDVSMSEEVSNVVDAFDLNQEDIKRITKNTIEAGFVDLELRKKLL